MENYFIGRQNQILRNSRTLYLLANALIRTNQKFFVPSAWAQLGSVHDARTKPRGGESQREDGAKKTSTKLKAFFAALS